MAEATAVRVARRIPPPRWTLSFFALLTAAPLAAILWTAAKPAGPIAAASVVDSLFETAAYVAGSVAIALVVGVGAAWAVVMRRFPGRTAFSWLLALPLALPPYLSAYAVADFFRRVLETPFYGIAPRPQSPASLCIRMCIFWRALLLCSNRAIFTLRRGCWVAANGARSCAFLCRWRGL